MKNMNHNFRFNPNKPDEARAWEILHNPVVAKRFKSQNAFVICAINDYFERILKMEADPFFITKERENEFADRITQIVERKVLDNLPALAGMYVSIQHGIVGAIKTETGVKSYFWCKFTFRFIAAMPPLVFVVPWQFHEVLLYTPNHEVS